MICSTDQFLGQSMAKKVVFLAEYLRIPNNCTISSIRIQIISWIDYAVRNYPLAEVSDLISLFASFHDCVVFEKVTRVIPKESMKTLDAPDLLDDFYCHLLDWSSQNIVAVALGSTVFLCALQFRWTLICAATNMVSKLENVFYYVFQLAMCLLLWYS